MSHQALRSGAHIFSCDSCPEAVEVEGTFQEAWAEVKADGWTAFMVKGAFHHECKLCSQEEA